MNNDLKPTQRSTEMATTKTEPSAQQTYKKNRGDIARVLDWLDLELTRHGTEAAAAPRNWGFVGDLGRVREKLIETLAFISNNEVDAIEDLLSEQE
jgi:hypothetical protein